MGLGYSLFIAFGCSILAGFVGGFGSFWLYGVISGDRIIGEGKQPPVTEIRFRIAVGNVSRVFNLIVFSDLSPASKIYVTPTDYFFLKDADLSSRVVGGRHVLEIKWTIPIVSSFYEGLEDRLLWAGWQEIQPAEV